jgi:hypothetical protein
VQKELDPPVLPQRDERYSVAVLEVHVQSFMPTLVESPEPSERPRQIEGPAEAA